MTLNLEPILQNEILKVLKNKIFFAVQGEGSRFKVKIQKGR